MILQQFPVVADPFFRRLFGSIGRQPEMGFADTLQSGIGELLLKPRFFRFVSAKNTISSLLFLRTIFFSPASLPGRKVSSP